MITQSKFNIAFFTLLFTTIFLSNPAFTLTKSQDYLKCSNSITIDFSELMPDELILSCQKAISTSPDDGLMQSSIGRLHLKRKEYEKAFVYLYKSAMQGNAYGQAHLGYMYLTGLGVPENKSEGIDWYRKSAAQDNAVGQAGLGYVYLNGEGVQKNAAQAFDWYRKAANQGNAAGQAGLGYGYLTGEGVSKDPTKAAGWYQKSAEQGNLESQLTLGNLYNRGIGISKDVHQAAIWYQKASDNTKKELCCWVVFIGSFFIPNRCLVHIFRYAYTSVVQISES